MNSSEPTTASFASQLKSRTIKQIGLISQPKHAPAEEWPGGGVRPDRVWPQRKWRRSNVQLVAAVEAMHIRRGGSMTRNDAGLIAELVDRTWGFHECEACHLRVLPSWMRDFFPQNRKPGWQQFLGLVIGAYRAGACGLFVSYAEAMALVGCNARDTWRRWCEEWEDLGLLRIVQTWTDDPSGQYGRVYGRLWYRLGPELEKFALALLEDAIADSRSELANLSRREAAYQRQEHRQRSLARLADLQRQQAPYADPKRRRKTKRPAISEQEAGASNAQAKSEVVRVCEDGPVHAAQIAQKEAPLISMQYDGRTVPPGSPGEFSNTKPQAKNESTAQTRPTPCRRAARPAARRPPPGGALRQMALDEASRRMAKGRRGDALPQAIGCEPPPGLLRPPFEPPRISQAIAANRERLRKFMLDARARADVIAKTLDVPIDTAHAWIREHAAQSAIVDKHATSASPPASPDEPGKLALNADLQRQLERRAKGFFDDPS